MEYEADVAIAEAFLVAGAAGVEGVPGDGDVTAFRAFEAGEGVKERGLSRTGFPGEEDRLAFGDIEGSAAEDFDGAATDFKRAVEVARGEMQTGWRCHAAVCGVGLAAGSFLVIQI